MLHRRMMLAGAIASSVAGLMFSGRREDTLPRYQWPAERWRDTTSAAYIAAEEKRARKNAKRLRDAARAKQKVER